MVETLSIADFQPRTSDGTGGLATKQRPSPSSGVQQGIGYCARKAGTRGGAQSTAATGESPAGRPGTEQTPRLTDGLNYTSASCIGCFGTR